MQFTKQAILMRRFKAEPGNTKGGSINVLLTSCLTGFGISCMTTDILCFSLQNRQIQTIQIGGQALVLPVNT
jgi:hypothetical protein